MEGQDVKSAAVTIDNGKFGKREIRFETGRLARQAAGTAVVYLDDETMLLSATTASKSPKDQFDFFPLTVDVEERMYAVGKIPGSFFRREGRPSEDAILTCRLIDRPLRPSFIKGLRNEVQIVVTVMALDQNHMYDVIAINAASMSTQLAGLPFSGPIGGVRIALIDGQWVAFPNHSDLENAVFDMVVAGRIAGDDVAIMMVEAEATVKSAIFERGETQILGITTLNMLKMEQQLDTLNPEDHKRYMHNYNFPPYSTGETGRVGSPKRREIGHGALAERALLPVLPGRQEFPYAIRQVSEALGSNGSTSMGSVCASTLSLLNAGVPLKAPVAGIAMGLISDDVDGKVEYVALTDILGAEDAFGDMDFKVAGTKDFVTALQLDTKLDGIPASVLSAALLQAKEARLAILKVMNEAIDRPDDMNPLAPRIISIKIPVDQIGAVIGPKGKVINQIQEETGAEISIEDDGTIFIGATNGTAADAAKAAILSIADPKLPEIGERYNGTIVKLATFGAFVNLLPGKDGLLHISQIRKMHGGKRIENLEDVMNVGDKVEVEIGEIDPKGKLSLIPVLDESQKSDTASE
ncbi:MAG: polyribonucleotide nucleotidyltransferase [Actinobacteria bacterium]|nr:polyribonucleotide nucleotidyltransferase [Actinomycetota bacterium]